MSSCDEPRRRSGVLGKGLRGRGPIGDNEAIRQTELNDVGPVDPSEAATLAPGERPELAGEFGVFFLECQARTPSASRHDPTPRPAGRP